MLDIPQLNALAVVLFIALALCIYARRAANGDLGIPPGPLGMPILGNLLEVPGKRLILIGDIRLAKELLERHANKHSSRPVVHYIVSYSSTPSI
ncbi:hypothetical protein C0993_008109 [Termitomyces sp. T159_Od127]|nr:hypothetical protein C0993_008109 [Termitomyces sp. T159_Od127]